MEKICRGSLQTSEEYMRSKRPKWDKVAWRGRKRDELDGIVCVSAEEDEIVDISDEDIGTCGGIVTLAQKVPAPAKRSFLDHWTTVKPLPMVRPNVKAKPRNLRPIVVDGSNVSYRKGSYYGSMLETCVLAFARAGHDVKAFVPQFRTMHPTTREAEILDELERSRFLVLTPSRSVDFKRVTPYDDRFIVEYADQTGAVIVSNDRYKDLLRENESWRETIHRRLPFCWFNNEIYFPKYPLGKDGPTLQELLSFPKNTLH